MPKTIENWRLSYAIIPVNNYVTKDFRIESCHKHILNYE